MLSSLGFLGGDGGRGKKPEGLQSTTDRRQLLFCPHGMVKKGWRNGTLRDRAFILKEYGDPETQKILA